MHDDDLPSFLKVLFWLLSFLAILGAIWFGTSCAPITLNDLG